MKTCSKCGLEKPFSEFHKSTHSTHQSWCKECKSTPEYIEYKKNYHETYRQRPEVIERKSKWQYFKNYPQATEEDYMNYLEATHCECCGVEFGQSKTRYGKCQDHNHDTGEIRGVICQRCNSVEGLIKDIPDFFWCMQNYKEKY